MKKFKPGDILISSTEIQKRIKEIAPKMARKFKGKRGIWNCKQKTHCYRKRIRRKEKISRDKRERDKKNKGN